MEHRKMEELRRAVYEIVRLIPAGRATSYGAIAKAAGYPGNSRLVGRIMGQCGGDVNIPAHRVVNSQGVLSGRSAFGHPARMEELLGNDGVEVVNNRIKNWKNVFWDPMREIG